MACESLTYSVPTEVRRRHPIDWKWCYRSFELPCCAWNQTCNFCAFYSGAFSLISLCVMYMFASSYYFFSEYVFLMLINKKLISKSLRRECGSTEKEALSFIKVCPYVLVGWDFRTML